METLRKIRSEWEQGGGRERSQQRARILDGAWLEACQHAVSTHDQEEIERWLRREGSSGAILDYVARLIHGGAFYARQMSAYLLCARAAMEKQPDTITHGLLAAGRGTGFPISFFRDLVAVFHGKPMAAACDSQRIGVLLVEDDRYGTAAQLLLERVPNGCGDLYPSPELGLTLRQDYFHEAEWVGAAAASPPSGRWSDGSSIRWSIQGIPAAPRKLRGESMGAAFAVGLRLLFESPCDLSRYAVSAAVDGYGNLRPVDHWSQKVECARKSSGQLSAMIVALDQIGAEDARDGLPILPTASVDTAVELLRKMIWEDRRRNWTRSAAVAILGVAVAAPLVVAGCHSRHHVEVSTAGRILIQRGIRLPFAAADPLDTGYYHFDFIPDRLQWLRKKTRLAGVGMRSWTRPVGEALGHSSAAALLFLRLGQNDQVQEILTPLLECPVPMERVAAGLIASRLDPEMSADAVKALLPLLCAPDHTGGYVVPRVARAIARIDPRQHDFVAAVLREFIDSHDDNFVKILAARVMVEVDPAFRPTAVSLLEPMLEDYNNALRANAARVLFEMDEQYLEPAIQMLHPLLIDPRQDVRTAAFNTLRSIGVCYPERISEVAHRSAAVARQFVKDNTGRIVIELALAQNLDELRGAIQSVGEFILNDRSQADAVVDFAGIRVAHLIRQQASPSQRQVVMDLLTEIHSPHAREWAVHRHACARAIGSVTGPNDRAWVHALLQETWQQETCPHARIALAVSQESVGGCSNPLSPTW